MKTEKKIVESNGRCANLTEQLRKMHQDVRQLSEEYAKVANEKEQCDNEWRQKSRDVEDLECTLASTKVLLDERTVEVRVLEKKVQRLAEPEAKAEALVVECEELKRTLLSQVDRLENEDADWEAGNELDAYSTLIAHMKSELKNTQDELEMTRKERDAAIHNLVRMQPIS